jgi:hypothetical protein
VTEPAADLWYLREEAGEQPQLSTPGPAPAAAAPPAAPPLTPAEAQRDIRAEIDTVRADKSHPWHDGKHPGHAQALLDMEHRYRLLSGEAKGPLPPEATPQESPHDALARVAAEATAMDLSKHEAKSVAQDAQDALRAITVTHDIPPTELPAFLAEAAQAQGRAGMDQATREAAREAKLREEWGDHYDVWAQRAWSVVAELPPRLQQYAEQYRMGEDPWMWLRAAELWKRKHQEVR